MPAGPPPTTQQVVFGIATSFSQSRTKLSNRFSGFCHPMTRGVAMNKLKDKVAVVTGASKGIGASIAKQLAAEGAAVVVNYASSKEGADRAVAEIVSKGGKAIEVEGKVVKLAEFDRRLFETGNGFGILDCLVST